MHTVFALLCLVVVIHWLIFPYPSGLLHWHCGNLTIAPVPAKQPWWIWINTSCEFIMNDCITTKKQSTTKPCAYFLGYTVPMDVAIMLGPHTWTLQAFIDHHDSLGILENILSSSAVPKRHFTVTTTKLLSLNWLIPKPPNCIANDYKYILLMHGMKFESIAKFIFEWKNLSMCGFICLQYMYYIYVQKGPYHRLIV